MPGCKGSRAGWAQPSSGKKKKNKHMLDNNESPAALLGGPLGRGMASMDCKLTSWFDVHNWHTVCRHARQGAPPKAV